MLAELKLAVFAEMKVLSMARACGVSMGMISRVIWLIWRLGAFKMLDSGRGLHHFVVKYGDVGNRFFSRHRGL